MADLGRGISARSSPGFGASTPPLKKKVTCAYFSVFRDAQLGDAVLGEVFAQGIVQRLRLEGDIQVGERRVVLRHGDVGHGLVAALAREAIEFRVDQRARDFAGAVGRKLKKITESPASMVATGLPSFTITVGSTNSSVTPAS